MTVAIIAAVCMVVQDILSVCMVQAEARSHGWLAGGIDVVAWNFGMVTATLSITAFQHHNMAAKVAVVVCVSMANLFGSKLGQVIGDRFITREA